MKHMKRLLALLLMLCLAAGIAVPASAVEDTCVVRVFGGTQRQGLITSITVKRGEQCNLSSALAGYLGTEVKDTKYYTKSMVRESGKEEVIEKLSFNVEKDRDFVLTYGVKTSQVTYYVRYTDADGKDLRDKSGPFTANSGDRVYVAYIEIDGYEPDAYNKVKTLTEDYTFVFVYKAVSSSTTGGGNTGGNGGGNTGGGGAATGGGGNGGGNTGGAANAGNNANTNQNQNQDQQTADDAAADQTDGTAANQTDNTAANQTDSTANGQANTPAESGGTSAYNGPLEIIDEDAVPLVAPDFGGGSGSGGSTVAGPNAPRAVEPNQRTVLPTWALILCIAVLVFLIGLLYWYLLFYRKKKKYASYGRDNFVILGDDEYYDI